MTQNKRCTWINNKKAIGQINGKGAEGQNADENGGLPKGRFY